MTFEDLRNYFQALIHPHGPLVTSLTVSPSIISLVRRLLLEAPDDGLARFAGIRLLENDYIPETKAVATYSDGSINVLNLRRKP